MDLLSWLALFLQFRSAPITGLRCEAGPALIVESVALRGVDKPRALVLWMCGVEKHEEEPYDHVYTCPDQTRGHFYRGLTWLSLVDSQTRKAIDTIPIRSDWSNERTFDVPYRIQPFFYRVDVPVDKFDEGKPKLLWLKDYNGDGDALEFALFDADNCTLVKTSLFGYSRARDRVIQYPIHLKENDVGKMSDRDSPWLDHFMLQKSINPGYWKWEYQYHVGGLTHFEIRYDRKAEAFEGEVVIDPERRR